LIIDRPIVAKTGLDGIWVPSSIMVTFPIPEELPVGESYNSNILNKM